MTTAEASLPRRMAKVVESASDRRSWCIGLKRLSFGRCPDICTYHWCHVPGPRMPLIPRYSGQFLQCLFHACLSCPLPSNRQHLSSDGKREDNQNCSVLCTTVVHNDMHTREQFLHFLHVSWV